MPVNRILLELIDEGFLDQGLGARQVERFIVYEPMKKNRFLVRFPDQFGGIESFCVSSTERPSWERLNGWCDITIRLVDLVSHSTTKILWDFIRWQEKGTNRETALLFVIESLDPTGLVLGRWEIFGLVIRIEFEELAYDSDDVSSTKVTIAPIDINLIVSDQ
jgi:hypothetical protein